MHCLFVISVILILLNALERCYFLINTFFFNGHNLDAHIFGGLFVRRVGTDNLENNYKIFQFYNIYIYERENIPTIGRPLLMSCYIPISFHELVKNRIQELFL